MVGHGITGVGVEDVGVICHVFEGIFGVRASVEIEVGDIELTNPMSEQFRGRDRRRTYLGVSKWGKRRVSAAGRRRIAVAILDPTPSLGRIFLQATVTVLGLTVFAPLGTGECT